MSDAPEILGGRYELGRLLGHGGMAEVYLGTDTRLHRTVAVKVLRHDLARDDSFQERFRREAQSAGGLNHPSIVAVYDTGEEHRTDPHGREITIPYIVMEYVEGRTLREFIREGHPMDTRQAAEIMVGVLSALEYSHHMGIVHRDIKPGNVMITDTGQVKVMDFGIARVVADATSAMTQTQAVMGTAQYLSPEQARGQLVDARSDIYSAACVLYELITGCPPFTGESPVSIAYQHVRETPVPPSTYNPQLSAGWDAVVLKGLAKDREERYSSAVAFSRDIAAVVAGRQPLLATGAAGTAATEAISAGGEDQATTVLGAVDDQATTVLPATGRRAAPVAGSPAISSPAAAPAETGTHTAVEEPKRKRKVWPIVLIVIAALAIIGGALAYFLSDTSGETAVPNVAGQTAAQASQQIKDAGFTPKIVETPDDTVAQGNAISTDPTAGTSAQKGTTVTINISAGPDAVSVPNLEGMTTDQASQALKSAGLEMSVAGSESSGTVDKDRVTRSEPTTGSAAKKGDTIKVWLSDGTVEVPDVSNQPKDAAQATLEKAGFKVSFTEEESDQTPGTVISTDPPGGDKIEKGSTVIVTVAKAAQVTIPNFQGSNADAASTQLSALGLTVERAQDFSDTVPAGSVIDTDPGANEKVAPGSKVTVIVSQGPAPTEEPSTTDAPTTTPAPTTGAPTTTPGDGNGNGNV